MKKILLTGGSGFVGQRFLNYNKEQFDIEAVSLRTTKIASIKLEEFDTIVHLAGKAHQMQKIDDQIYFDVNFELTRQLADLAKAANVAQFIFVSTIKVYGDNYDNAHLALDTICQPDDAYGASKLKAEQYLQQIGTADFKIAIVRPPLVYGPGVKGNMIRFIKLAAQPIPLPFGGINNERTMVFLDNLIELLNTIVNQRSTGVFLAGDNQPLSTSRLLELIQLKLKQKSNLFKLPTFMVNLLHRIKPELIKRLFFSLTVDTKVTNNQLNYTPPFTSEYGIEQMVNWFKKEKEETK